LGGIVSNVQQSNLQPPKNISQKGWQLDPPFALDVPFSFLSAEHIFDPP
jgi:hypothetical protein